MLRLSLASSAIRSLSSGSLARTSTSANPTTIHSNRSPLLSGLHRQRRTVYSERVIDHYKNPRNVGSLNKNDQTVGTGLVGAPACGDVMKLQIRVGEDGRIVESVFKTFGCGSAIASSSLATEWIKGKTLNECLEIKNSDIASYLSLPPVKLHCSMLAEDAIKAAVRDYMGKNPGSTVQVQKAELEDLIQAGLDKKEKKEAADQSSN